MAALGYKEKGMNETVDVYPEKYEGILKATHEIGFPQLSENPLPFTKCHSPLATNGILFKSCE